MESTNQGEAPKLSHSRFGKAARLHGRRRTIRSETQTEETGRWRSAGRRPGSRRPRSTTRSIPTPNPPIWEYDLKKGFCRRLAFSS
jgi:hypothetical protein